MTDSGEDPRDPRVDPGRQPGRLWAPVVEPLSEAVAIELALEQAGADEEEMAAESAAGPIAAHPAILVPIPPEPVVEPLSEAVAIELARPPARRRRRRGIFRFFGGFLFGLLAVFALSAGGLYAFEQQYSGRIMPGVHVGQVDVSGLTASQATARLADAFASFSDGELVLVAGDLSLRTPLAALGRRPDVEAMVVAAMDVGRDASGIERLVSDARMAARGLVLDPLVLVDATAVERTISTFAASVDRAPASARVDAAAGVFTLVPEVAGRATDARDLLARVLEAIRPVGLPSSTMVEARVDPIAPVVTTEEASAAMNLAGRMSSDITVADVLKSWTITAEQVRTWISFEATSSGGYRPVANPAGLDAQLADIAKVIARPPANATYLMDKNGRIVGSSEGVDGRTLDAAGTVTALAALMTQRGAGETVAGIAPAVTITRPELTTEQAAATAPLMAKISEWTTYFPISDRNGYGANIWIPAMDIDGYVVAPGAWFDFWKAIGPVTRERGYVDGGAIINGHTEPQGALAGGICSTSTTLFNAALRAGLQMGARQNHYYYIGRYPLGLDATVWQSSDGSTQSMTFRNDTAHPILIRAYKIKNGSSGYVKFELYGVPTGRTVSLSTPIVKNPTKAIDTVQSTDTLPTGQTQRLEVPTDGMDVWVTVTVADAGGTVIHNTTYYSHYARVDGLTLIGTG